MSKDKMIPILGYYMDYEFHTRMMDNSIRGNGNDEPIEILEDPDEIIKVISKKKIETISKSIKKACISGSVTEKEIKDKSKEILDNQIEIGDFIANLELKKYEKKEAIIEKVLAIKDNNSITICYPLIESKGKDKTKKPVVTFVCEIKDNGINVKEYYLNKESLLTILAYAEDSTAREIELCKGDTFNNTLSKINNIEGQTNIDKIIKLIDSELFTSFDDSRIDSILKFNGDNYWNRLNRVCITNEELNEIMVPIFEEEISYCKKTIKDKSSDILEKYLLGNGKAVEYKDVSNKFKFHYGSYTDKYPINEKQWEVVTLSGGADVLSVDGPPGTGKTTLLKEIIADNITLKAKKLVDSWNEEWKKVTENNGTTYKEWLVSPLGGENKHSIVLTSTNNKAVDNIGVELLKEIPFFTEMFNENDKETKGVLCSRLGKRANVEDFYNHQFLKVIELLKNINESELSEEPLLKFNKLWSELEQIKSTLMEFDNSRQMVYKTFKIGSFDTNILEGHKVELEEDLIKEEALKKQKLDQINKLTDNKSVNEQDKRKYEIIKTNTEEEITKTNELKKKLYKIQDEYKGKTKNGIRRFIMCLFSSQWKEFFNNYPSEEYIKNEIKDSENKLSSYEDKLSELKDKIVNVDVNIKEIQSNIETNKAAASDIDNIIKEIKDKMEVITSYNKICAITEELIELEKISDMNLYTLINCNKIVGARKQLFDASLTVTELYIKKNSKSIISNLEMILNKTDSMFRWCQKFYNPKHEFNDERKGAIIALWETFFLCFPVVTTTLHSFKKDTFQIIQGLFDLLMVDEAGQILPHYLCAPLYRAKRSIVVGDTKQLEPIRLVKNDIIMNSKLDESIHDYIGINKNSAQNYIDRVSDVYQINNNEKSGILLEEHRRCEKNIMKFSNELIYDKLLSIVNDNDHKKLFGSNLIAFDIRGIKEKLHFNRLEISTCKRLIEEYKSEYGVEVLKDIAIISPFSRQVQELQKEIMFEFPEVEIGTVHTFQGREKDIVIFTTVIDDVRGRKKGLSDFIGSKGNLLNVAFSRAKKQFVLVGNFEVIEQSSPYLKDALRIIKENGKCYSFFDLDLNDESEENIENWRKAAVILTSGSENTININSKLNYFISEKCPENIIVGPAVHYQLLKGAIELADKEICIFSPWINEYVVDSSFYQLIKVATQNSVKISICFGYKGKKAELDDENNIIEILKSNGGFGKDLNGTAAILLKMKKELGVNIVYLPPIHTKLLLIDGSYMIIGSHNWLANSGKTKNNEYKEMSCLVTNYNSISYVKDRYISRFLGEIK